MASKRDAQGGIDRRTFLGTGIAACAAIGVGGQAAASGSDAAAAGAAPAANGVPPFEFDEVTVKDLQLALDSGVLTTRRLTESYLARIDQVDRHGPALNSVIELNPDALELADQLDAERKAKKVRGPLHGIPVLIKDNIDTADKLRTSAGSLALAEGTAPRDAGVAERLRAGGALILGKTNLSEWANFRSTHSSSGWSGRGGQTKNPYALDRNPCGSSSGTGAGISANLAAVGVGTETDGSIVCPSHMCGIVGLKPTVGLVSRAGIIPISSTQDTAGPMGRTVADVAALLGVLAGEDARDPATKGAAAHVVNYMSALDPGGLKGARIGVARKLFNSGPAVDRLIETSLEALRSAGAVLVDPAEIPNVGKYDDAELEVMLYEFKAGLNEYLQTRPSLPYRSLADLIAFNDQNRARELPFFGQELFLDAQKKGPLSSPAYRKALSTCRRLSRAEGVDAVLLKHKLDAIVAPTGGPAWVTDLVNGDHFSGSSSTPAAVSGYPSITVPAGQIFGLPVGLTFIGGAWQEAKLLRYAYAFEQTTKARRAPRFLPTLTF